MNRIDDLIYKDLCYKLVGFAFEVQNTLGSGLKEKVYADAFEEVLKNENIRYAREYYYPIKIRDKTIARRFFDFLIEDKIIIELKVGADNYREVCNQIFEYLKASDLKLGLIFRFTKEGVKTKRIPNIY